MHEENTTPHRRSWGDYLGLTVRGFAMGAADVVPGVSGGTMAFVLGIYDELLDSIRRMVNPQALGLALRGKFRVALDLLPWPFLLGVGVGILLAVFSLAHFLEWSLEQYPTLVWSFFFGLVGASIWAVSRRVHRWDWLAIFSTVVGAALLYWIIGLTPVETPTAPWFIFLSGFIAICAMILPGISGSFILVLLGKYQYILSAVTSRDFLTLTIFAAGAGVGIVSFAQVLSWLLKRYHNVTIVFLIGLMIGSLRKLWPWKQIMTGAGGDPAFLYEVNVLPAAWNSEVTLAIVLAVVGFSLVLLIEAWAMRNERSIQTTAAASPVQRAG
jgi:putative membrane protein